MKTEERLASLGLTKAADVVKDTKELNRKMCIAGEHYRIVRPEKIKVFNEKLRKKTEVQQGPYSSTYDTLVFIEFAKFTQIPPNDVLDKVEEAQQLGCFDEFEIAKIESIKEVKDPIVFGRINNCPDRFYIAQWDDDVKIEDILAKNEG